MNWYPRENYLKKIRDFYHETDIIKVITGVRRCGKSCIMETIASELKESGIPTDRLYFFDLDSKAYHKILKAEQLEALLESIPPVSETKYLFIDEIQNVMETKGINEANIELYEDFFNDCENASLSVKTINGEMVAKFNVDSEKENHSLTVTKCNEKQKLDSIVEAYEVFGYAFRTDEWEDILEPLENWLKQNNN